MKKKVANIDRFIAKFKNKVTDTLKESGQMDLGNRRKVTWNWCGDKRYLSPRYKYAKITGSDIYQSGKFTS